MSKYKVQRIRFVEYGPKAVNCMALEDSDRERLAVCRQDGSIQIWSTTPRGYAWSIDFVIPSRVERSIDSVTWCHNRLFTAGLEGQLIEWDLENLVEKTTADACGGPVWCIAGSNDKNFIAAGCEDGSVRLFDIQYGGLEPGKTLNKQEFRVLSLAWSKCDSIIVTGSTDSTIRIYNVITSRIVSRISTDKLREKNTLIWAIHLTSDMTIISGDSLGQTQFWDGQMGTLLKSFKSHEADVLAVCVSEDEKSIYSSGIDSRIAEFKFETDESTGDVEWRMTRKLRSVNHDVRALSVTKFHDKCLIAGGVDPRVSVFKVDTGLLTGKFLSTFPDVPPCCLAKNSNVLVFYETNKIHAWKLPFLGEEGGELALPNKLLELKSPKEDYITCADISPNGKLIVFADIKSLYAYEISCSFDLPMKPETQVRKIKLPKGVSKGFKKIKMLPDGSRAIFASSKGIGIIDICGKDKSIAIIEGSKDLKGPWYLLEVDETGSYAASVNVNHEIYIFCLKTGSLECKVPQSSCKKLAIKFQPKTNNLVSVSVQKDVHIYDFVAKKIDDWSVQINKAKLLAKSTARRTKFINISFDQKDNSIAFLQSENGFIKMKIGAKTIGDKKLMRAGEKRKLQDGKLDCITSIPQYKSLLYIDTTKENALLVVECPFDRIFNALPPALKIKRFGR